MPGERERVCDRKLRSAPQRESGSDSPEAGPRDLTLFHIRVRNKSKMKPVDVVDANNDELRRLLLRAEYAVFAGDDVVRDDRHGPGGNSASDSN